MHQRGLAREIFVWARREAARKTCAKKDWCTGAFEGKELAIKNADLIVLCMPVGIIPRTLEEISPFVQPGTLVTDVGSVKAEIARVGDQCIQGKSAFIGSHPMAGSEKSGIKNATADLFRGRPCFITPTEDSPEWAVTKIAAFWQAMEMNISRTPPDGHDRIVARISHLPHLLASVLSQYANDHETDLKPHVSTGFLDTTRIAAGNPSLWLSIFQDNQPAVLESLASFRSHLESAEQMLREKKWDELENLLTAGKEFRDSL